MLSLRGSSISSGRRDFLRVGGLGLGGISLADMLEFKARASENGISLRDKAVVFLFMHGGPPQAETELLGQRPAASPWERGSASGSVLQGVSQREEVRLPFHVGRG